MSGELHGQQGGDHQFPTTWFVLVNPEWDRNLLFLRRRSGYELHYYWLWEW